MADDVGQAAARKLLVGREVSAVCFARDHVEIHLDGPAVRAFTAPFGLYGCTGWRFPDADAVARMRSYIGKVVDDFLVVPGEYAQLAFGEHSITIPLATSPDLTREALHVVGVDAQGRPDPSSVWTC